MVAVSAHNAATDAAMDGRCRGTEQPEGFGLPRSGDHLRAQTALAHLRACALARPPRRARSRP